MLELVMARAREQMVKLPHELPIAQEKNNLSTVLTEMSAACPGGLEVSTADQHSQDLRFKTNSKKNYLRVKHFCNRVMMKTNTNLFFLCRRTRRITRVFALQRTCIAWQPKARVLR
jgi:hypothetical protein